MNIELKRIRRCFGEQRALDIDHLSIGAGEVLGLTGANGSGKTTLLRIVGGLDTQFDGDVLYNGEKHKQPGRHGVCYVHQQAVVLRRSVFHNVTYPLALRGLTHESRLALAEKEIERFGLTEVASKRADKLSGGETQRMCLARAILTAPKLLLLDEPMAAIDAKAAEYVLQRLADYHAETNASIVLVSHGERDLDTLCTRLIRLDKGRIVSDSAR